ncbi:MAG TPA: glycoside hydrolase family 3 C-terminal domain-containing protein [Verrucomicrobiae bacterium]|jgi:beta-glucosidase|nr:glycoside hydrolase family 3 C-terminal domain-containing protein [Verrucomicrobiae bacterium]
MNMKKYGLIGWFVVSGGLALAAVEPNPLTAPLTSEKPLYLDTGAPIDRRVADLVSRLTLEEKGVALDHDGPDLERIGLRSDKWNQCLHGVVWTQPTTMFPVSIAMAATWDTNLVHQEGVAISDEARAIYNGWHQDPHFIGAHKGLIYRAPVINISRNPYWGRINECYGEDPFLTGRIGVAYVEGLQGDDPHYLKLAATLKHFAVNNVEKNRQSLSATVSERMLYEYWLPHWRDCVVEAHAQSLMASYNGINGTPNNINHWLLTDVLKNLWHHEGFVVSDLGGVDSMVNGHFDSRITFVDAVAESLMAGCDFSDKEFRENIPLAVRTNKLTEARLDDAVTRVLRTRMRLGEFDPQEKNPYSKISTNVIGSPENRALALKAAREAIVLLENKNDFLPLDKTKLKTIAVIGPHADLFTAGGYSGIARNPVKPLEGIRNHVSGAEIIYAAGCSITTGQRRNADAPAVDEAKEMQEAVDAARRADVAVLYLGTTTGIESEGRDRTSLGLPANQEKLAEAVIAANPKTVVVLMSAGPLVVPWLKDHARAMLQGWWLGEEGGNAIADVIFGDVNPSGRLPYTIYASEMQVPPQDEYDISKGYTYMYVKGAPLYPFGFGLSYSQFSYSGLQVPQRGISADEKISVTVNVKNTGHRAGDDVVQLYTREINPSVTRPVRELRGFQRVSLAAGETKAVTFAVPAEKLAYYDETQHAFVVESGKYEIQIGAFATDIRATATLQVTGGVGGKCPAIPQAK